MKKIRTVHIDDEKLSRDGFAIILDKHFPQIEMVGQAENALEGMLLIKEVKPDLVFLDINMPGGNGIDLLEAFDNLDFEVIFLTAHDNYAIKAIKKEAFDYLLKPVDVKELANCLERLQIHVASKHQQDKILIHTMESIELISYNQIMFLKSDNNYTHFNLEGGKTILASKSLSHFKKILPEDNFKAVHQSYLVNFSKVSSYKKVDNGILVLSDKTEIPISRSNKQEVLSLLER